MGECRPLRSEERGAEEGFTVSTEHVLKTRSYVLPVDAVVITEALATFLERRPFYCFYYHLTSNSSTLSPAPVGTVRTVSNEREARPHSRTQSPHRLLRFVRARRRCVDSRPRWTILNVENPHFISVLKSDEMAGRIWEFR